MKYSLQWINEHLAGELPEISAVLREVTLRAFEVEEVVQKDADTILDIKVLPDRAHDALSHRGMAREIGALFGISRKEKSEIVITTNPSTPRVRVTIENSSLCPRYIATRVDNVTVGSTRVTVARKLESVGARSINNIVDITNVVLFDMGQPLHAFDADKVVGGITVRLAKQGEVMTTLDNKALTLHGTELVIADDEGVLALAGIKGGKKAEVTSSTKNIILESANFDPTLTRKTSQKHNIKTDASKRYENGITSDFAKEGSMQALAQIAVDGGAGAQIGESTDVHTEMEQPATVTITAEDVNHLLGLSLSADELTKVLTRAGHQFERTGEECVVKIPRERLDLRIKEDMIEEIGRHVGYENIEAKLPELKRKGIPHKRLFYSNKVRRFLIERGFSEVFTYSFASEKGDGIEVLMPVGDDRPYLRAQIARPSGLRGALELNKYNAPIIGVSRVDIFEFGNVFKESGEEFHLVVATANGGAKRYKELVGLIEEICQLFNVKEVPTGDGDMAEPHAICEMNFDILIKDLPERTTYEPLVVEEKAVRYQTLSVFPFIVRDIAIFVPQEVGEKYIETLLRREAGELLTRFSQFDKFQKPNENRISYGYRMVFQSHERTLTDETVNDIMTRITAQCNTETNWQVR